MCGVIRAANGEPGVSCVGFPPLNSATSAARRRVRPGSSTLPALFHRDLDGQIPAGARIFAISRTAYDAAAYRAFAAAALGPAIEAANDSGGWQRFAARLEHITLDAQSDAGWDRLGAEKKVFA